MKIKFQYAVLLFIILMIINCAYYEAELFRDELASMVNVLTYDQAIMNWGPPLQSVEGDKVFVAMWGAEKAGAVAMPVGKMYMAVPVDSGWKLTLGFDKKTRKMVSWKYDQW